MSEEEKKAIEDFKLQIEEEKRELPYSEESLKYKQIILKLVEKQQKEIEEYKNVIDNKEFTWKQKYEETFEYVKENYISKDKIKEKIEELKKVKGDFATYIAKSERIAVLEKLLEESE